MALIVFTIPGSVAGLPDSMATLPQLMRKSGYSAHMVGKWHLGHSQRKQTPVGRGFESHTGGYMWSLESYTKLMWKRPWEVLAADWAESTENGPTRHFLEPRHATIAITETSIEVMENHHGDKPLFLYVSYNAAHSPLQSEPSWDRKCSHIPHLWRREYCGLMVGLDEAVGKLEEEARRKLGDNTVIVITSDNGGSTWFGGVNAPLRAGKVTPFEGGVRVPALALDLSGGVYLGQGDRDVKEMIHVSDWMPTFLGLAGGSNLVEGLSLDGMDQGGVLRGRGTGRENLLLDAFTEHDSHDGQWVRAFR